MSAIPLSAGPVQPLIELEEASADSVLVIDDDRSTQVLIAGLLGTQGLRLEQAGTLKQAHALLERTKFDLIIVDGLLPDGTGVDFISTLRKAGCRSEILFVSSFFKDFQSFRELRNDLGVTAVLHKPLSPSRLIPAVRQALGRS